MLIETLGTVLPIIIYFLLIILLVITIVLGVKIILTVDRINTLVEDIEYNIEKLSNVFNFANFLSDRMQDLADGIFGSVLSAVKNALGFSMRDEFDDE